ncbi:class I SAM-dependent methyltransferase [Rhodoferax saidenbachensis]|uniref:SAM-dependent methyltransferase n=1 Tax=Rhodoferax saidenbachensis TaxID=1484693 RepID=A0A1P8K8Z5_9BURK|nr:methyltransferase domain-containing protein [Rhodoferax saidenbachensis]APW42469.1 SAM-dependent methyltransferase [Rhodoferax saidenbachensis]
MTTEVPGTIGYGTNASALASQYESITFAEVYCDLVHLLPLSPITVLDIGAGSGRDAAALARRGHKVVAVEPTDELRHEGQRLHGAMPIEWINDHLPDLSVLRQAQRKFDLVLLTAVWMHLDLSEREAAMTAVADLVADGGQVFISLRHGPIPEGRRMFDVSADETTRLAAQHELHCHAHCEREDMLGRDDVRWSFLALRRPSQGL